MKITATIQDRISEMPTTWKIENVYSPALVFAMPIGRKPAAVINVPVSIGNAVLVYANSPRARDPSPAPS